MGLPTGFRAGVSLVIHQFHLPITNAEDNYILLKVCPCNDPQDFLETTPHPSIEGLEGFWGAGHKMGLGFEVNAEDRAVVVPFLLEPPGEGRQLGAVVLDEPIHVRSPFFPGLRALIVEGGKHELKPNISNY